MCVASTACRRGCWKLGMRNIMLAISAHRISLYSLSFNPSIHATFSSVLWVSGAACTTFHAHPPRSTPFFLKHRKASPAKRHKLLPCRCACCLSKLKKSSHSRSAESRLTSWLVTSCSLPLRTTLTSIVSFCSFSLRNWRSLCQSLPAPASQ
jgi:hypothetical protein